MPGTPSPMNTGAVVNQSRSSTPAARNAETSRPPPSTSTRPRPRDRSSASTAARRESAVQPGRSRTTSTCGFTDSGAGAHRSHDPQCRDARPSSSTRTSGRHPTARIEHDPDRGRARDRADRQPRDRRRSPCWRRPRRRRPGRGAGAGARGPRPGNVVRVAGPGRDEAVRALRELGDGQLAGRPSTRGP